MNHLEIKSGKRNINEHTKFRIQQKKRNQRYRNLKREKERQKEGVRYKIDENHIKFNFPN